MFRTHTYAFLFKYYYCMEFGSACDLTIMSCVPPGMNTLLALPVTSATFWSGQNNACKWVEGSPFFPGKGKKRRISLWLFGFLNKE